MKVLIKYILISITLLCVIALFLLCATTEGLKLDIQYLSRFVPGQMKIGRVSGTLFSAFSLQHIFYQYAGQTITIQSLYVQWFPSQLLKGKLAFDKLSIENAHIQFIDHSAENNSRMNAANDSKNNIANHLNTHTENNYKTNIKNRLKTNTDNNFKINTKNNPKTNTDNYPKTSIEALYSKLKLLHFVIFNQLIIDNMLLQNGKQWITIQGKLDNNWNIRWSFNLPNIHDFMTDMNGSLQGTGAITGPRSVPSIYVIVHGTQLAYSKKVISTIHASANMTLQPNKNSYLTLKASGIKINDTLFDKINVTMQGFIKQTQKELSTFIQLNV